MPSTDQGHLPYTEFLDNFKKSLHKAFYEIDDIEKFSQQRGFPKPVLDEILSNIPLSVSIPSEYGGRGAIVKECIGLLEASSYESLSLSLIFGINLALFLEPVAKYGQEEAKQAIFRRFLEEKNMGGLMITEPEYGSDALNMQTSCTKMDDQYHIQGTKHWQGLTGMADYWLMTCRSKSESGRLGRDLDFFITDEHVDAQKIVVEELFNAGGLYPIPYGTNIVDIKVPETYKLIPESTGLKLMMDLLHRSRSQFPGMGLGFIHRNLDIAIEQCTTRVVGGKTLTELDEVQYQLAALQSAYVVTSAMCHSSAQWSGIDNNLAGNAVEANSFKAYVSDLMQWSSQIAVQLCGANGYKSEHFSTRGIMDSRPFQIFEGTNAMLYTQITEIIAKKMDRSKEPNVHSFLKSFELTDLVADEFKNLLNFDLEGTLPQRKQVHLGQILARVVCAQKVLGMSDAGFRKDLIDGCMDRLRHEVKTILGAYNDGYSDNVVVDYGDNSRWLDLL